MDRPSRRDMLWCGACLAAVGCDPATPGQPASPTPTSTPWPAVTPQPGFDPCVVPGSEAEGWTPLLLADYPELEPLYGFTYVSLEGINLVIAQVEPGCYVALERECTHEGVQIEYRESRNGFVCPRHGAIYGWDGTVLGGPAPLDLRAFPVGGSGDVVWILLP